MKTEDNKTLLELILALKVDMKSLKETVKETTTIVPDEYNCITGDDVQKILKINKDSLIKYRASGEIKYKKYGTATYRYPIKQFQFIEPKSSKSATG